MLGWGWKGVLRSFSHLLKAQWEARLGQCSQGGCMSLGQDSKLRQLHGAWVLKHAGFR